MSIKKPIVINLFGPPGSGKSTGAAEIFAQDYECFVTVDIKVYY